jgi:hypothetical protein
MLQQGVEVELDALEQHCMRWNDDMLRYQNLDRCIIPRTIILWKRMSPTAVQALDLFSTSGATDCAT